MSATALGFAKYTQCVAWGQVTSGLCFWSEMSLQFSWTLLAWTHLFSSQSRALPDSSCCGSRSLQGSSSSVVWTFQFRLCLASRKYPVPLDTPRLGHVQVPVSAELSHPPAGAAGRARAQSRDPGETLPCSARSAQPPRVPSAAG